MLMRLLPEQCSGKTQLHRVVKPREIRCEFSGISVEPNRGKLQVYLISRYIINTFTHYADVIMGAIVSQITSLTIVYSTVYSDTDQRKHQSSASLAFVLGIHRGPVNSPHK